MHFYNQYGNTYVIKVLFFIHSFGQRAEVHRIDIIIIVSSDSTLNIGDQT